MKNLKTKDLVLAGLFAALVFVGTFSIKLPLPSGIGYIHLGDSFVYLCGAILGPVLGGVAAGLGSMLADLLAGYAIYAPVTFIIKALNAMIVGYAFKFAVKSQDSFFKKIVAFIISSAIAGVVMVTGYFLYEVVLYQAAAASANVVFNITQAVGSLVVASVLYSIFRNPMLSKYME